MADEPAATGPSVDLVDADDRPPRKKGKVSKGHANYRLRYFPAFRMHSYNASRTSRQAKAVSRQMPIFIPH
jgi:hypothetical protein